MGAVMAGMRQLAGIMAMGELPASSAITAAQGRVSTANPRRRSPENHGVYGETQGNWGWASGVYGKAFKTNAIGVTGWNTGYGAGVYGYSEDGATMVAKTPYGNLIEAWDTSPNERRFYVSNGGDVYADGRYNSYGADVAELLPAVRGMEPGDVLVMGPDGQLTRSTSAYDPAVVGVYSTDPGFVGGVTIDEDHRGKAPLAIVGIVPCKVSDENGPIAVGSLLTTSRTAGYAMKATNAPAGTIVGKARRVARGHRDHRHPGDAALVLRRRFRRNARLSRSRIEGMTLCDRGHRVELARKKVGDT